MASTPVKILICLGSVRDGRMCARLGQFLTKTFKDEAKNVETEILDPQELDIPLLKQPLHFYPDQQQAPKILRELNEKIKRADAYLIVTAEYNRQMPPALTNMLDHFPPRSYAFKCSAIASYSLGQGGASATAQARTLMVELGAPPAPFIFHLPEISKSLDENGKPTTPEIGERLTKNAKKLLTQLLWYASATKNHRATAGEPDWPAFAVSL